MLLVSKFRGELEKHLLMNMSSHNVIKKLMYKELFADFAQKNNYLIPVTYVANNFEVLLRIEKQLRYSCILKPSVRTTTWDYEGAEKNYQIYSDNELFSVYKHVNNWCDEVIIQEWIPGADSDVYYCLVYYNNQGQLLTHYC